MKYLTTLAATLCMLLASTQAYSAICLPRPNVMKQLTEKYEEVINSYGLSGDSLVELWVSHEGATWTVTVTHPNMSTCILGAGEDWIETDSEPAARGDET